MTARTLLSRTAESLYWLGRYAERADAMARLIEMGHRTAMLPGAYARQEWRSVAAASGCLDLFPEGEAITETAIIRTLLLDQENPSSIRSCLERARSNARSVRTALTMVMWEALNDGWRTLELMDPTEAQRDLSGVLDWVKKRAALIRGASTSTMLRNDGYQFLGLGGYLERADMILRLLDVKSYVLLPETEVIGGARNHYQWTSVLHATSAVRAYHHVYRGDYNPAQIAEFLILYDRFPRSVAFNVQNINHCLGELRDTYGAEHPCHQMAADLRRDLAEMRMDRIYRKGLSSYLRETNGRVQRLSAEIYSAYHF